VRESIYSFWQDTGFNALGDQPLSPQDVAYRDWEGVEESWTGEAWDGEGRYFKIFFSIYKGEGKAYLFLRGGKEQLQREIVAPPQAEKGRLQVHIGPGQIKQEEEGFSLLWQDINVELSFLPSLPPWQPGSGRLDFDEKGERYLYWTIPVPRAEVKGTLLGEEFQGQGCIEHLLYNFPLKDILTRVLLGRFYADNYTLLWSSFRGNLFYSHREAVALYLASGQEMLASTPNLEIKVLEWKRQGGISYPESLILKGGINPPLQLEGEGGQPSCKRPLSFLAPEGLVVCFTGDLRVATLPEERLKGRGFIHVCSM